MGPFAIAVRFAFYRGFACTMDMRRLIASLWHRYRIPFAVGPFAIAVRFAYYRCFAYTMHMRRLIAFLWYCYRIPFAMGPFALGCRTHLAFLLAANAFLYRMFISMLISMLRMLDMLDMLL
jgi:hypothetical protein